MLGHYVIFKNLNTTVTFKVNFENDFFVKFFTVSSAVSSFKHPCV